MAAAVAAGRKERGPKAAAAAASPSRRRGARKTPATGQGDFQSWENSMASPVGRNGFELHGGDDGGRCGGCRGDGESVGKHGIWKGFKVTQIKYLC